MSFITGTGEEIRMGLGNGAASNQMPKHTKGHYRVYTEGVNVWLGGIPGLDWANLSLAGEGGI